MNSLNFCLGNSLCLFLFSSTTFLNIGFLVDSFFFQYFVYIISYLQFLLTNPLIILLGWGVCLLCMQWVIFLLFSKFSLPFTFENLVWLYSHFHFQPIWSPLDLMSLDDPFFAHVYKFSTIIALNSLSVSVFLLIWVSMYILLLFMVFCKSCMFSSLILFLFALLAG